MTYQYLTGQTSPFQSPRTQPIQSITIHWWDKPERNPTFQGTVDWLCRIGTTASIHYVAEAGRVACLVSPDNIAWHAGDGGLGMGNNTSIGIECNPRQSDGDYLTVAELVRDLRTVYGNLPIYPHRHWTNTECPGTYDLARINRLAATPAPSQEDEMNPEQNRMLVAIYNALFNKKSMPTPDNQSIVGGEALDELINNNDVKILTKLEEISKKLS